MPDKQDKNGPTTPHSSAPDDGDPLSVIKHGEQRFYELIESLPMIAVQGYDKNRRVINGGRIIGTPVGSRSNEAANRRRVY